VHDAGGDGTKSSGVARHGWIGHERAKSRFHRLHPRGWIADDGIREVKVVASNATNDPPQNVRRIEQHRLTYRAQGECLEAGRFGDKKSSRRRLMCAAGLRNLKRGARYAKASIGPIVTSSPVVPWSGPIGSVRQGGRR